MIMLNPVHKKGFVLLQYCPFVLLPLTVRAHGPVLTRSTVVSVDDTVPTLIALCTHTVVRAICVATCGTITTW